MKQLLLLRHAKAVPGEQALADSSRPLAERGKRDARYIAERLSRHLPRPDIILASPAVRTLHTARIVARAFELPPDSIVVDQRLYLAVPAGLLEVIAAQPAHAERLLIVGHNPGLSDLAHELLPTFDVEDLPTGAAAVLDYPSAASWAALQPASARLGYYDFPKNARPPLTLTPR